MRRVPPSSIEAFTPATATAPAGATAYPIGLPPDATAMLLYTSGTTGAPKAACIGHASLRAHTTALVEQVLGLTATDRVLAVLPMSHSYGCRMTLLATFMAGATTVLVERFSARGSLEVMRRHGITWCPAVPTMFAAWAASNGCEDDAPPKSLRWCLSAGASLSEPLRQRAQQVLGCQIRQGYGMTEATFSTVDHPPTPARPGTVGRAVPGVEVRITVPQLGDDKGGGGASRPPAPLQPAGTMGHVEVRGPNVMQRYLSAPEATAHRIRDGWVQTGDLGALSADGWLTITGRIKDVIIRGGATIYPAEVEEALLTVDGVTDAAVVGRADPFYGESVCAVLVADPSVHPALVRACETLLAPDKRPSDFVFVDSLPIGASGKILKRKLVAQLADGRLLVANA